MVGAFAALPIITLASGPWLNFNPSTASPGSTVQASGGGFAPNESINVSIAGGSLGHATADQGGTFKNASVVVPAKPAGNYQALATGDHRDQAIGNFYIAGYYPIASPSAWYILPGQTLNFTGSGFSPGEAVSISGAATGSTSSGADGHFSSGLMTVPFAWQGTTKTFMVQSVVSGASIPITVTIGSFYPQIEPSKYYVDHGGNLNAFGHGFAPNEMVNLLINGKQVMQASADSVGQVSFSFSAPSVGGSFELSAQGTLSHKSSTRTVSLH